MNYDPDKVDDAALALLWLTASRERPEFLYQAWKGMDWDTLDRLHTKGWISNPKNKNKSILFSDEGAKRAQELFQRLFAKG